MMSKVIVILLIVISLYYVKKYSVNGFVVLVALIGSDTDSLGILNYILINFSYYKILIRTFVLSIFLILIIKYFIKGRIYKTFFLYYFLPLLIVFLNIFSINMFRKEGLITSLSEVIYLGIPFFFLWIEDCKNRKRLFFDFIFIQLLVSILILNLKSFTKGINGATYMNILGGKAYEMLNPNIIINANISFGNFNKHSLSVLKFAQFHNSNSLGFYASIAILIPIFYYEKNKIKSIILFSFGVVCWFNSLTKGPIFFFVCVFIIYLLVTNLKKTSYKKLFIFFIIFLLFSVRIESFISIFKYFDVKKDDISIISRLDGYKYAFKTIVESPVFGIDPKGILEVPHLLFLKIASYYGIITSILLAIPIFHITFTAFNRVIKNNCNKKRRFNRLYVLLLISTLWGALLTNGVICYVLFWVILGECFLELNIKTKPKLII